MRFFIEWLALKGILAHLGRGPLDAAYERTRRIARFGRTILRSEWGWTLRNLELVFGPALEPDDRRVLAEIAFEEHFFSYMEGLRRTEIDVPIEGRERLQAAHAHGRGVVGVAVHVGGFEAGLSHVASEEIPASAVFRPALNPRSARVFEETRIVPHGEWIEETDGRGMRAALSAGRLLLILVDLDMPQQGLEVPLLGVPAMTGSGPAKLALRPRPGSPVVPLITIREAPGLVRLHVGEVLDPAESADAENPAADVMRRVHAALEPWMIEYAEQYNWLHPRWRTRPSGPRWTLDDPIDSLWEQRTEPFAPVPERVRQLIRDRKR